MLPKDFRGYLDYLESKGKLLRVKKPVDVKYEVAAGIRKTSDIDGPALLFENLKGFPGWRMAGGLYATKKLMALALETEPDENKLLQRYLDCDQQRIKPKLVPTGPVKEVIIKGDDVDLTRLPVPTYCEKDSGPYIIACAEIGKDPRTGIQNVTIGRRRVVDRYRTTLAASLVQHLGLIAQAGEEMDQPVGVAVVLGAPPELTLASQIKAPMGVDETEIAGALRGEPLEMVKCETIDVEVPAHAEVIIEGVVLPGEREWDGPFGEYPGDYITMGGMVKRQRPVVKTTAITMRRNPIFQAMATGMPMTENHWLKKWSYGAAIYRLVKSVVPRPDDVKGVNLTEGGTAANNVVVAIHKRLDRTPQDIIYTLLSSRYWIKNVIVVDDDIDIFNPLEVERAWATRMSPTQDIIVVQGPGGVLGYNTNVPGMWGIDATAPLADREWYAKAVPPGVDQVDYL